MQRKAMLNESVDCCIKMNVAPYHKSINNLTDVYLLARPCFSPKESFVDILLYIMNMNHDAQKRLESCPTQTSPQPVCNVQGNQGSPGLATFWVLVLLVAVGGNLTVCLVIYNAQMLRNILSNHFIASLAVSDLMVGLFLVPVQIYSSLNFGRLCISRFLCHYYKTMDSISFVASITNLLVITADRFIAVEWPYTYQDIVTKTRSKIAIGVVWFNALLIGGLSNVNWSDESSDTTVACWTDNKIYITLLFTIVFYAPTVLMGIAQGRMLFIALRHSRDINAAIPMTAVSKDGSNDEISSINHAKQFVNRFKKVLREYRAVKIIMVVFGTFVLCWLPVTIIALLHAWCPGCVTLKTWQTTLLVDVLPVLNSTLNFFIYSVMNREFRKNFKRLLKRAYMWCTNDIG
ncbi:dopamine receptor 4-like isoform X2 [Rhopilema esculentum]|uniref:dopamine receptor 4-like isoform X2 n=1 Tax=Rhopilema esculentum TaxID=499914 RepID=UPI0031DE211C